MLLTYLCSTFFFKTHNFQSRFISSTFYVTLEEFCPISDLFIRTKAVEQIYYSLSDFWSKQSSFHPTTSSQVP